MNLSFKNRIAIYYMVATATIMALVFSSIFFIVKETVLRNLDNDLSYEAKKHTDEIKLNGDSIQFINKTEWEEREHREIQVNPVFIQLINKDGKLMDKSPNLKQNQLTFRDPKFGEHFDTRLNERTIRQIQIPIERDGETRGYILAAMSSESSLSVISKLRNVLILSYFIVLIGLYFVSRFLAGRSIIPIQEMTNTITRITRNNLNERVSYPPNHDEIYKLSESFNALLERIENALEREKQFTSDASHELRTPLATLRGTLEVLIRKPRTQEEYEQKIKCSLDEIERMTSTLEQLLLIARLETVASDKDNKTNIPLATLIEESLSKYKSRIIDKNIKINLDINQTDQDLVPHYYSKIIIDNILNNAIKYSNQDSEINISIKSIDNRTLCTIRDTGIGIKEEDLNRIYDSFFRSDALSHKQISGNGLGLSIVKKCADAIQAKIKIDSKVDQGTTVTISF